MANPMMYAALLPGLLARKPKESQDTQTGRAGLMDSGAAYRGMQSSFKQQADTYAEAQYEEFAARRRALLEADGEAFNMRALEDAAKALPKSKGK